MYYIYHQEHNFLKTNLGEPHWVSAIIPVYGKKISTIGTTIRNVQNQSYDQLEIIIVSNGVPEIQVLANIEDRKNVRVVCIDKNMGAAYARNQGARVARGSILWFIDSDVFDIPDQSASLAVEQFKKNPRLGSLGGIIYPDKQFSYFVIGRLKYRFVEKQFERGQELIDDDFVNTACIFVLREAFNKINGFTDFIEYPFDDVDFGFKLCAAGYRCAGLFSCSGRHPLYSANNAVFYQFMSMHNMLLYLALNFDVKTFTRLLKRKQETGWKISPPTSSSSVFVRLFEQFRRVAGMLWAFFHLLRHFWTVWKLRNERQKFLKFAFANKGAL